MTRLPLAALLLTPLAGCVAKDDTADDSDVVACTDASPADITAEVTAMPTVIRVSWTTPASTEGYVRYTEVGGHELTSATSTGLTHEVLLTGLHALADVSFAVVSDGVSCGEPGSITTGALPAGMPGIHATTTDAAEGGYTVLPILTESDTYVAAIDSAGLPVWAYQLPPGGMTPRAVPRAMLSQDGTTILYNDQATAVDTPAFLHRISVDGELLDSIPVPGGHTDFVERAPGEYAMLGWDIRTFGDRQLLGDTIVEFDETGATHTVWSSFDTIEPDLGETYQKNWYVPDPEVEDWSHVNSISYDAAEDAYFVTMALDEAVVRVDRSTGTSAWRLSDSAGDFTPTNPPVLELPHSVQSLGDSLLAFNRGDPLDPDSCSTASEITLDLDAGTATRAWTYRSDPCVLVLFLGEARRLSGGNTMVVFTTAGQVDEVTPAGELAGRLYMDMGAAFGVGERAARLGPGDTTTP